MFIVFNKIAASIDAINIIVIVYYYTLIFLLYFRIKFDFFSKVFDEYFSEVWNLKAQVIH